jgi:hypothetical protein
MEIRAPATAVADSPEFGTVRAKPLSNQTAFSEHGRLMSNGHRIAGFIVVAASFAGCANDPTPETAPETPAVSSERATVTGRVVDTHGVAVAGATVLVRTSGEHAMADSTGKFTLDVPANTTLTLAATAANMAPTLLQQFLVSPGASASVEMTMVTSDHFKSLVAMGDNPSGGMVAVALKSLSGSGSIAGATVELTPSLGRVMYPATSDGMADPDPSMAAVVQSAHSDDAYAWALGVQPHVSIMQLALHGAAQVEPPYAIDDVIWPGTFTVDAGALTLVTLFAK